MQYLAAFTLGFLGSFHCIGMCGPIALTLPLGGKSISGKIFCGLAYNSGRIVTYSLFGLLFGLLGKGFSLVGFQQSISVTSGLLIIASVVLPKGITDKVKPNAFFYSIVSGVKTAFRKLITRRGVVSLFTVGLLNGLLPCGFVYLAAVGAVATGTAATGSLFMVFFGAGTIPVMLALPFAANCLNLQARTKIVKAMPVIIIAMGLLLVLRGMNLGIPYISPEMSGGNGEAKVRCH